jgi:hypothetical protein
MELTKPAVWALAPEAGINTTAETSIAIDKQRGNSFFIITFLTKT